MNPEPNDNRPHPFEIAFVAFMAYLIICFTVWALVRHIIPLSK